MKKPKTILIENRKAYHDYTILETFEAGIVLQGTEVKSLRMRKAQLRDSYVQMQGNYPVLVGLWIGQYSHGNIHNHEEKRPRKLLLHKNEILKLMQRFQERLTIIPLEIYLKDSRFFKVRIALAKGKKLYDKRQKEKEKSDRREIKEQYK